ncbi:hypothetical protein L5515_017343 [Caenorhabditis briggsae]|uniref:Uncharacterized protein n=1 Tax=Caenorhabditis briggsae TaxID=6238 RepID=A0AAE9F8A8_CAEBR|nr:hypothetical protein L5515_017343 [Caenorhabditis briggsae]
MRNYSELTSHEAIVVDPAMEMMTAILTAMILEDGDQMFSPELRGTDTLSINRTIQTNCDCTMWSESGVVMSKIQYTDWKVAADLSNSSDSDPAAPEDDEVLGLL